MKDAYDCIVVGSGPAGAVAALHAVRQGVSVLILEKDPEVGVPVRCAEGVGGEGLREFIEPDPSFASSTINRVRLVAPDNQVVDITVPIAGYVLDRTVFDKRLCQQATDAGAELQTGANAVNLLCPTGAVTGVVVECEGEVREIRSRVVIGADGIESRVGRWAGLKTVIKMRDMESCAQVTVHSDRVDPGYCEFFFGSQVAPGGYAWVFPKGPDSANVGLGICALEGKKHSALYYLRTFLSRRFPEYTVLKAVCGGVPAAKTLPVITGDGIVLAGDAAHQVNPLTGGGIVNGMKGGRLAGRVAAEAIRVGDVSNHRLQMYQREWMALMGNAHVRYYRLKEAVNKLSDDAFNRLIAVLRVIPPDDLTLKKVFLTVLKDQPRLLLDVAKVWW